MNNIDAKPCLNKAVTQQEVKTYFTKVLALARSGEQYPVNLDEVWPLVYAYKRDAVESLKGNFMQDIDYQVLRKIPQNSTGGRPNEKYKLSVPCMEWFIARKVRPVFDVYRQVFHQTINTSQNPYDTSRNILPGVFSPKTKMIAGTSIWTIILNGIMYYRLKEILLAAGIYQQKRKDTSEAWFKPYVYWMNDQTSEKPKRYVREDGILIILSKTRVIENPKFTLFLNAFTSQDEGTPQITEGKNIDLKKFLDIIINTQDNENRNFLYDIYKKLKGEEGSF